MKSSTYDDSSGMPAEAKKALCGSVSAKTNATRRWRLLTDNPRCRGLSSPFDTGCLATDSKPGKPGDTASANFR
jgi:hypothetical protein